jgi:predicted ATPase
LGFAIPSEFSPCTLPPNESKKTLFEVLIYLLCLDYPNKSKGRYVFIIEDIQWADPISLEFIKMLTSNTHFLYSTHTFISTSRQCPPDILKGVVKPLVELKKFSLTEVNTFASQLFDGLQLTVSLRNFINERTDGIPLFIIKLIDMLKQKEQIFEAEDKMFLLLQHSNYEVPCSLRETLQQQLDSLIFGKKIAQIAAVIGREFDYELLRQSAGQDEDQLELMLDELINSGLIYIKPKYHKRRFVFKHALVRETAYDNMPRLLRLETQKLLMQSSQTC